MDSLFSINPPENFNFGDYSSWPNWIRRFERFRIAAGLDAKDERYQVNSLMYAMGDKADDILSTLGLSNDEQKKYKSVKEAFDKHFIGKQNVIYERARFNKRSQEPGESAESFIAAVYKLAENCQYGPLQDEMIRDRLVVGTQYQTLSEKLQMDSGLTLEKAVQQIRQHEEIKKQQHVVRETNIKDVKEANVDALKFKKKTFKEYQARKTFNRNSQSENQKAFKNCGRCGKSPAHPKSTCGARDAICRKCQKKGHFAAVCRSSRIGAVVEDDDNTLFLGAVSAGTHPNNWKKTVEVNGKNVIFKLDTGADVTVIPAATYSKDLHGQLAKAEKALCGPGGEALKVKGQFDAVMKYKDRTTTQPVYVIQRLSTPLLGFPAISALGLLHLVDSVKELEDDMKKSYPKVFTGLGLLKGEYKIKLKEGAKPYALSLPRRVPLPLYDKVKAELERMEKMGVIEAIEEPTEWCAGMVVAPKPNEKVRICSDMTHLNEYVCRERHILPAVDETLAKFAGATVFTKLDATAGFWQVPLHPESVPLTTFITPFGRYCYKRLPFGISSAPEHFQKRLTQMLSGLDGTVCHADDILVFGSTREQHDQRLHRVLERLQQEGLTLNNDKCQFAVEKVMFLGHIVSAQGIEADPGKIRAIKEMPTPKDAADVKRFVGMVNYVGKFSPRVAELTQPLRELLKADTNWEWGTAQQRAFDELRKELSSPAVLAQYCLNRETKIAADASSFGLGGVLSQKQPTGEWRPVAFISRSMTNAERRYAQIEKEALALTWACERFQSYLVGMDFLIQTDHKPLISLLGSRALDDLPARILRFRLRLLRFTYRIEHVPGKNLITADTLSRAPIQAPPTIQDKQLEEDVCVSVNQILQQLPASESKLAQIRKAQEMDITCQKLKNLVQTGWPTSRKALPPELQVYWQYHQDLLIADGLLMKSERLVIPVNMQEEMLKMVHEGHQGMTKCIARAQQSIWWPGLTKQIKSKVENCTVCAREVHVAPEPLMTTQLPSRPWQRVAADLFQWNRAMYLLVVDYFSRYIEVANLTSTTAVPVVNKLKAIFARHGVPETLVTDNGPQFSAAEFAAFAKDYDFSHVTTSPHYPQSNGEAERAVKTIKALLKKGEDPHKALMAYRATPLAHGSSPAQLLMGRNIRTPLPVSEEKLQPKWPNLLHFRSKDQDQKQKQASWFNKRHKAQTKQELRAGQQVWVKNTNSPGTVSSSANTPRSYVIDMPSGRFRRNRSHIRVIPEGPTVTRSGRVVRTPQRLDL
uniref:Gypsy retrotransposon integrase-like protein 1 n=1 Tax=Oryzias melastigma TaxID=30732 RepID=A0A3B3C9Q2_ORYME